MPLRVGASIPLLTIQVRGGHLGTVYASVGVASFWLSVSMQIYRDLQHWHLDTSDRGAREGVCDFARDAYRDGALPEASLLGVRLRLYLAETILGCRFVFCFVHLCR